MKMRQPKRILKFFAIILIVIAAIIFIASLIMGWSPSFIPLVFWAGIILLVASKVWPEKFGRAGKGAKAAIWLLILFATISIVAQLLPTQATESLSPLLGIFPEISAEKNKDSKEDIQKELNALGFPPPRKVCDYHHWVKKSHSFDEIPKGGDFKWMVPERVRSVRYSMSSGLFCGRDPSNGGCPQWATFGDKRWKTKEGMMNPKEGKLYVGYALTPIRWVKISYESWECHAMVDNPDYHRWMTQHELLQQKAKELKK